MTGVMSIQGLIGTIRAPMWCLLLLKEIIVWIIIIVGITSRKGWLKG
jgi:hypothetical protein